VPLLLVLAFGTFVSALSMRIIDPVVPQIAREFGVGLATAAMLSAAFTFPYAIGQPLLGPLGDAIGKARVIKIGLAVLALSLAVSAVAPTIEALFLVRVIGGFASGAIIPLALAAVGDRFRFEQRQIALTRILMAATLGQIAGVSCSGLVASVLDWRVMMGVCAAITGAGMALTMAGLKPRPDARRVRFTIHGIRVGYSRVFQNPRAYVCFLTVFLEGLMVFGLLPYIAGMLEHSGAGGVREAGFVLAGTGIGGVLFTVLARGLLHVLGGMTNLMRAGGVVTACGLLTVATGESWPVDLLGFTIIGCGFYMLHNSLQTEATELAPANRGSAVAAHAFFFFLGQAAGVLVYQHAIAHFGPQVPVIGAAVLFLLLALWSAQMLRRPRPVTIG
jgi:predicted MFS family arabinose efflux permease